MVQVRNGRLSVDVAGAPVGEVLAALGRAGGFRTAAVGPLDAAVEARFTDLPLVEGIHRLFSGHSVAIVYRGPPSGSHAGFSPAVDEVWLLESEKPEGGPAVAAAEPVERAVPTSPVARADGTDMLERTPGLAQAVTAGVLGRLLAGEPDPEGRKQLVGVLGRLGGEAAAEVLAGALGDPDPDVRRVAVESLGNSDNPAAVRGLGRALIGDPDPELRRLAVEWVAQREGEMARALLLVATEDPDPEVRQAARESLAAAGLEEQ
ncbi:MAG: hypothetical protein Kow0092_25360 [Deferrisomatales bacterium]